MDGRTPERCTECGFDAGAWQVRDAGTLLDELAPWWRNATRDLFPSELNRRPAPGVWSVLEYGVHSALVTAVLRDAVEQVLAADGCELPGAPEAPPDDAVAPRLDPAAVIADLDREARAFAALTRDAPVDAWTHRGVSPDGALQARAALLHAVHDATHHQMDVGRGLAAIGAGTRPGAGRVAQISASDGGVPKTAVPAGRIGFGGLDGDHHADRHHHGRPFQALCLWSSEVIDTLAAAGHDLGPGSAGENLTLAGLDWAGLRPGARLRIGAALAELSFPATPCAKQARWFTDRDFTRIGYDANPGWTRWYAWVREPGAVSVDDAVVLQP